MLIKVLRFVLGYITFSFKNGFRDDFINDCFCSGIRLKNIKIVGDTLVAECSPKDYKRLHSIAFAHGGVVKVEKRHGVFLALSRYSNRVGLAIGTVACIILFSILSGFIWNIEIVGNDKLSQSEISNFLDENGFRTGAFWKSVDKSVVEDLMMAGFDEIAWVHINRFGTTARVEISETVEKPNVVEENSATNLKATKDGVIVSAITYNGWQAVKVGESVRAGDILVSGVYESEKAKENLFAHARGEFIARVEEKIDLCVSRTEKQKSFMPEKTYRAISFFGLYLPLYIGKIPNQNAEIQKEVQYIRINSNPVPVGIIVHNVKKYNLVEHSMSDKELSEKMQATLNEYLKTEYGEENIVSRNVSIALASESARATGSVIALENIGEEIPMSKNLITENELTTD